MDEVVILSVIIQIPLALINNTTPASLARAPRVGFNQTKPDINTGGESRVVAYFSTADITTYVF